MRLFIAAIFSLMMIIPVSAGGYDRASDPNGWYSSNMDITGRYMGAEPLMPPRVKVKKERRAKRSDRTANYADHRQSGWGGGSLVSEARRHIGQGAAALGLRRSLWCGAFMDMILRNTGHKGGSNLARDYANYGTRVSGPQVGAIAVMSRGRRGGHVGVVSGIDASGNPIIISGNHGHRVAEATYSRGRIYAYVLP